jgi:spermidine synthase
MVVGLAILTVGCMFVRGPTAAWRHSGIGVGRTIDPSLGPNAMRQWINENRQTLVWEADGIESSIGINALDGLSFVVNGKSDGNSLTDAATQIGISSLAAVLHDDPKTALVIGLGTGETAGWLADMRNVERVDVVELEPAIDEMARRCREVNRDVMNHPRVRRIYNDGREFVLATRNTYDLVVSEPSNPYRAGVATLYTSEFYQAVRNRLNDGGLFIQWLQAYEVNEETVHAVLATARGVFQHVEVWQTLPDDFQLVCSPTPLEYSASQLRERIDSETVKEALALSWNVDSLDGFLSHFMASAGWADEIARRPGIPRNTDDRTILEYRFAKTAGRQTPFSVETARRQLAASNLQRPLLHGETVDWNAVELQRQVFNLLYGGELSSALLSKPADKALVESFVAFRKNDFAAAVNSWPAAYRPPVSDIQRLLLARCYAELARPDCLELIASLESRFPLEAAALNAVFYVRLGNTAEAARALEQFYELLATTPWDVSAIAQTALPRTIEIARADRSAAERLYPQLCQPFASYRYDYLRKLVRFIVAQQLDREKMIEALAEMEPNVRWTAAVLQPRAEAYRAAGHPLAVRAERDWQSFQRYEPGQ